MPLLELCQVSKWFGGVPALREITLALEAGERVALIGENGAGKSTLIKLLSGVHQPDAGEIRWLGERAVFRHPVNAMAAGISTIHQELAYFEKLTVAENMLMGEGWPRKRWGGTDWEGLNAEAARRLQLCDLNFAPDALFQTLSPAERQEVAIARALALEAKLLILDEPSASLTEPEVERLFSHLERMRAKGVGFIYVSHRLDEVLKLTDRVVVLRDGALVAQYPTEAADVPRMVRDMVGREIQVAQRSDEVSREEKASAHPILRVEDLSLDPFFEDIHFEVHPGEVLGLGGLVGAGRSEVGRTIYGLYHAVGGRMVLDGQDYSPAHPAEARARGVVYVPEERKRQGFVLDHSLREGIGIGLLSKIARGGLVRRSLEKELIGESVRRFSIRTADMEQAVGTLSGGNQQKALIARALETSPRLVVLDEPTRGVDVGSKAEIHRMIRQLAGSGKGVLLISSDLPELLMVSDRITVLHEGKTMKEFRASEATQEDILLAASGMAN